MISVKYTDRGINVNVEKTYDIFNLPLKVCFNKFMSNEIIWSSENNDYTYSSFPQKEMINIEILDSQGKQILFKKWNVVEEGSFIYRQLYFFCKNILTTGRRPQGLAIGTHDGEFGEWVPVADENLSNICLVEGTKSHFEKLKKNFEKNQNITFIHDIVTPEGGEVEFFEGGQGYTNSVVERVIQSWETEPIYSYKRNSISINELIDQLHPLDWIHLDLEGLDAKILMAMNTLPKFIIYEHNNLIDDEKKELENYLRSKGYEIYCESVSCSCIR